MMQIVFSEPNTGQKYFRHSCGDKMYLAGDLAKEYEHGAYIEEDAVDARKVGGAWYCMYKSPERSVSYNMQLIDQIKLAMQGMDVTIHTQKQRIQLLEKNLQMCLEVLSYIKNSKDIKDETEIQRVKRMGEIIFELLNPTK